MPGMKHIGSITMALRTVITTTSIIIIIIIVIINIVIIISSGSITSISMFSFNRSLLPLSLVV